MALGGRQRSALRSICAALGNSSLSIISIRKEAGPGWPDPLGFPWHLKTTMTLKIIKPPWHLKNKMQALSFKWASLKRSDFSAARAWCKKLPRCPHWEQRGCSCSVYDPSHSRLLPCAGCRSLWVSSPRKHFSYKDTSVHCLWVYISCIPWVQAWWSQILPKPTEAMEKEGLSRNPHVMTAHIPQSCILAGGSSTSSFDWVHFMWTMRKLRKLFKFIVSHIQ